MIDEKQLISHLYQNRDNGQWMIQTNDEHQKGVADMVPVAQLKIIKTSNPFCCIYY